MSKKISLAISQKNEINVTLFIIFLFQSCKQFVNKTFKLKEDGLSRKSNLTENLDLSDDDDVDVCEGDSAAGFCSRVFALLVT